MARRVPDSGWKTRVIGALVIAGHPVGAGARFNPVQAMVATLEEGYGLDSRSARRLGATPWPSPPDPQPRTR